MLLHVTYIYALILVVRICLSLRTDTVFGDVSLIIMVTRQVRSYWYVSHRFIAATGTRYHRTTINTCTRYHGLTTAVLLLLYTTTATTQIDVCAAVQVEEAFTARNTTWYSLLLTGILLLLIGTSAGAWQALTQYRQSHGKLRGLANTRCHGLGHDYYTVTIHHYHGRSQQKIGPNIVFKNSSIYRFLLVP